MQLPQIEVQGETVEVLEAVPLSQWTADADHWEMVSRQWRWQGVTNVLRVRRNGREARVLEYQPGVYLYQRRYTLQGDERAGREPSPLDNSI